MFLKSSGWRRARRLALALGVAGLVAAGCAGNTEAVYPERTSKTQYDPAGSKKEQDSIFGPGGFTLFGGGKKQDGEGSGSAGIGVNSFLWRASLDTLAFMPLASADPFGGVIITEWYSPPQTPAERFKVTVYILDRTLRADGVKVAVFRQARAGEQWQDQAVTPETAVNLENAILTRARQLRIDAAGL